MVYFSNFVCNISRSQKTTSTCPRLFYNVIRGLVTNTLIAPNLVFWALWKFKLCTYSICIACCLSWEQVVHLTERKNNMDFSSLNIYFKINACALSRSKQLSSMSKIFWNYYTQVCDLIFVHTVLAFWIIKFNICSATFFTNALNDRPSFSSRSWGFKVCLQVLIRNVTMQTFDLNFCHTTINPRGQREGASSRTPTCIGFYTSRNKSLATLFLLTLKYLLHNHVFVSILHTYLNMQLIFSYIYNVTDQNDLFHIWSTGKILIIANNYLQNCHT